jgi:hypothetical protein
LWAWFVGQVDDRRRNRVRKPTAAEQMAELTAALRQVEQAMAAALLPSVRRAVAAMRKFNDAWKRIQDTT